MVGRAHVGSRCQGEFGPAVARLVDGLTDVSRPGDANRAARKAIDRAHVAAASVRAMRS
jgi:hypothetical protein